MSMGVWICRMKCFIASRKPEARNDRNPHIIHCASHCCVIMWSTQMILTWVFCGHIWLTSHRILIGVAHWYTHILWEQLEWLYLDSGCWSIYTHSWLMNKEIHCRKGEVLLVKLSWQKLNVKYHDWKSKWTRSLHCIWPQRWSKTIQWSCFGQLL